MPNTRLAIRYVDFCEEIIKNISTQINESDTISSFIDEKAIKVEIGRFKEMVLIDGKMMLIDYFGQQYFPFVELTLDDLLLLTE